MKKTLKSIALAAACVLGVAGLVACEEKHEHTWSYEPDPTKHRQVCECEEKTVWEPHVWGDWVETEAATLDKKGSHYRICSVCNYKETADIDQLTPATGETTAEWTAVYAQVPAEWTEVNIYYWNDAKNGNLSSDYEVGWPGKAMTLVNETDHIYGYQLPKGVDRVIFNNAGKPQTIDLKWSPDRNMFVVGTATEGNLPATYKSYTPKDTDPELAKPEKNDPIEYVTMYVQLPEAWETCNLHFWGAPVGNTDWPGLAMTKVADQENVWMCDKVVKGANAFIVNNKVGDAGVQTGNIESVPAEANAFIVTQDGENYVGAPAKYENGTFTPLEVKIDKTITELYVRGDMNAWAADPAGQLKIENNEASIEIEIKAGQNFKVSDSKWTGWSTFGYVDSLGAEFEAGDGGNIKCVVDGTYIIKVANLADGETPVLTITAKPADPQPQPSEATPHTNTYDYALITGATADREKIGQDKFTGANAFLTVMEGKVTYRNKALDTTGKAPDCIEIKDEALQVTFKGTGTITITFSSTGGTNKSRLMLKAADGTIIEGETTATKITATDEVDKNGAAVNEVGAYEVTGTTMVTVTFTITEAGTYTICSPSGVTTRGCRIGSIVMVDNYKDETQTEAQA